MPDIFISYSSQDRAKAQLIATGLKADGFDVWWDGDLRAGEPYDEVIEKNLRNAKSVVVLWSKTSAKSKWVRAEATVGERHSTIVPAIIEECERPLRFELIQTADLIQWHGDHTDPNWKSFVADINLALRAGKTDLTPTEGASVEPHNQTKEQPESVEAVFWSTIKETTNPAELNAYLERYKDGQFSDLARQRLAALASERARVEGPTTENPQHNAGQKVPRQLVAIAIFASTMMLGIVILVLANAIHIGGFEWTPSAGAGQLDTGFKEVGFYAALNWSLAVLFLMPLAWTLIYLALSEVGDAWAQMVEQRMVVTEDLSPIGVNHLGFQSLQKHIRIFLIGGVVTVTTLMTLLAMSDHAQVAGQFYGSVGEVEKLNRIDSQGYPLETPNIERDWMVASFLSSAQPDDVNRNFNNAFSLTTYVIYVGLGIGSLISFGLVMIGVGATFMRGVAQNYGLQIIPNLRSDDRRCGYEVMQKFFTYAYAIALIGCALCYLMGVQNIYLRSPDESIFAFLAPDLQAFEQAANWGDATNALFGFLFADTVATGTRNAYVWIFGFLAFAVFMGGFLFLLRQGAVFGRSAVMLAFQSKGGAQLAVLTSKDAGAVERQLSEMQIWPLMFPTLYKSLTIVALFAASFIFYKVGALIVGGSTIALLNILLKTDRNLSMKHDRTDKSVPLMP